MAALAIAACESSESGRGDVPDSGSATPFEAGGGGDAIFEAYDAANVLIGTKTAAAVGDGSNAGTVVKSSGGGVEVDHLQYGR